MFQKSFKSHNFIAFEGKKRMDKNVPVQTCSKMTQHKL